MSVLTSYLSHPFHVLGATPRDTRTELVEKQADLAIFGDDVESEQALSSLLNLQSRLQAELRWFPLTKSEEIEPLLQYARDAKPGDAVPTFHTESHLAQFNALRLLLSTLPWQQGLELKALLLSLSVAADALLPRQVMEEINGDRTEAGFVLLDNPAEVDTQVEALFYETLRDVRPLAQDRLTPDARTDLCESLTQAYTDRKSPYHNSFLLQLAARELA